MHAQEFRSVVGRFATGVAVVTCPGPAGLTTNAFCSVSLDPLLVLVCFDDSSRTLGVVREAGAFGVNVLRSEDEEVARTFAGKGTMAEKFAAVAHHEVRGVPVLDGALAWLVCDVAELQGAGDHTIAIGAVRDGGLGPEGAPLLFHAGAYGEIASA